MWSDLLRVLASGRKSAAGNAPKTMPLVVGELAMLLSASRPTGLRRPSAGAPHQTSGFWRPVNVRSCAFQTFVRIGALASERHYREAAWVNARSVLVDVLDRHDGVLHCFLPFQFQAERKLSAGGADLEQAGGGPLVGQVAGVG